jgi:hypothetical protein
MLAISPILDEEPAAKLDKPAKYDAREINRAALKHWPIVASHLFDLKGFPLGDVARLGPELRRA